MNFPNASSHPGCFAGISAFIFAPTPFFLHPWHYFIINFFLFLFPDNNVNINRRFFVKVEQRRKVVFKVVKFYEGNLVRGMNENYL